ncbi:unnamed protein product [Echinostoma caproni]|uniref:Uncharacterized protein n=1 Tax=Echinostoma caproni TaxID=27848 RepID=A0A183B051_9TREM|nr:unnamed protein product [Echinostoma caproni]
MVDSIRHLSLKLRQCSDKLVQRVNAEQNAALISSPTDRRTSRASSTDSVPTSTKFALSDALENMRMINQQLKMVDELLFSQGWNEGQQQQQQPTTTRSDSSDHGTGKTGPNLFTFVPIDRNEPSSPQVSRDLPLSAPVNRVVLHPGTKVTTKTRTSAFVLPGQVPPQSQTLRPPMDEEDEYY